jgi:hypothetical protein
MMVVLIPCLFATTGCSTGSDYDGKMPRDVEGRHAASDAYEFVAKLKSVGMRSDLELPVIATALSGCRWVAVFVDVKAEGGNPPIEPDGTLRYAVHSLAELDLAGREGKTFRVRAKVVERGASQVHKITECQVID